MSAKALAPCTFVPATDHPVPECLAAELCFHEDLWREYRTEALNAGLSTAEAAEYASALSREMSPAGSALEMAPFRRDWFYQSRARVVRRTITSGLIERTRWERYKATGRTAAAGASGLARRFRWWNVRDTS
jgi:hypothetical protein